MFIERDGGGAIKGVYRQRQPGYAEEELADDHPDVLAFHAATPATPLAALTLYAGDLADLLVAKGVLTRAEVDAKKK